MNKKEYKYYQTFFDIGQIRKIALILDHEKIDYKIIDKSNQRNFRVPQSTYIEIDLFINEIDINRIDKILKNFNS